MKTATFILAAMNALLFLYWLNSAADATNRQRETYCRRMAQISLVGMVIATIGHVVALCT